MITVMPNWRLMCVSCLVTGVLGAPAIAQNSKSEPLMVRISKPDCQRVVRHQASADVAYKPGVDVRGNAVAPAEASGGFTIPLPDVFEFNITRDLAAYLGGAEDKLAADKAAAIAGERSVSATDAALASAETSLAGAETAYDAAVAAATAAPNDAALAAAAASAETNLAATQTAYDATQTAASADDVSSALTQSQAALAAAKQTGYIPDAAATTESETASQAAADAEAADKAALQAAETVAKSSDMTLNIGTVRYDIRSGAMTFNGQPLTGQSEADLAAQCRAMLQAK
ncbi:MAG: hypothetical protein WD075_09440 [Rhodospirillales bacterium]